jgi:hypothetical protein
MMNRGGDKFLTLYESAVSMKAINWEEKILRVHDQQLDLQLMAAKRRYHDEEIRLCTSQ